MALTGFREYFARISPTWLQGPFGSKYVAGVVGLIGDMIQINATLGLKAGWLKLSTSPPDAVAPVGEGSNMPRYFTDTDATYKARVVDRWDVWESAGSKPQLLALLNTMGFPNASIYEAIHDWPARPPTPYWSQFWIVIPSSDHSFSAGSVYGAATYGAMTYGISGTAVTETISAIKSAIGQFKPGHAILRSIIFETPDGFTYGTGETYGSGITYGGADNIVVSGT